MSRGRANASRKAQSARRGHKPQAPFTAGMAPKGEVGVGTLGAMGVLGRSAARAGLSVPLYLQALQAGAMARLEEARTGQWSQHDLQRLLLAAERLGLDPLGGEIYAVPGGPDAAGPALLVLGVDGWCRVLNAHPAYLGVEFCEGPNREPVAHGIQGAGQAVAFEGGLPAWVECTLHRNDRRVPTTVREYMAEARTDSPAWMSHPRRMLRHKALVQCARVAFGLAGLHDPDEARRVQEATGAVPAGGLPRGHGGPNRPASRGGPVGMGELKAALCRA